MDEQNPPSSFRSFQRRMTTDGQRRENVKIGSEVEIVLKKDQGTGKLTRGIVAEILTSSAFHHRGIKVRLQDGQAPYHRRGRATGQVGRVQKIYPVFPKMNGQEYQEGLI